MKQITENELMEELKWLRDRLNGFISADMKDMDNLHMIGLDICSLSELELIEG